MKDGTDKVDDCKPCPPGHVCPNTADVAKVVECPQGSYCKGGGAAVTCPAGFYCPRGTGLPVPCRSGEVCSKAGLAEPDGVCKEGYACGYTEVANPIGDYAFCTCLESGTCKRGATAVDERDF